MARFIGTISDDTFQGGDGVDHAKGDDGDDWLDGGGGDDLLRGQGGADHLTGGAGADLIKGAAGADVLAGWSGDDTLYGGGGADTLRGGAGDDTLNSGAGSDVMIGGAGRDVFQFDDIQIGHGVDSIRDFELGVDVIDLRLIDADTSRDGDQEFTLVEGFTDHPGQFVLVSDIKHSRTLVEMDVDGDGKADMTISVHGLLHGSDLVL